MEDLSREDTAFQKIALAGHTAYHVHLARSNKLLVRKVDFDLRYCSSE